MLASLHFQATKLTEELLTAGRDLNLFLILVDLVKKDIDRLERSCTSLQGSQVEGLCGLPGQIIQARHHEQSALHSSI